jgi:hypothetical protein
MIAAIVLVIRKTQRGHRSGSFRTTGDSGVVVLTGALS